MLIFIGIIKYYVKTKSNACVMILILELYAVL